MAVLGSNNGGWAGELVALLMSEISTGYREGCLTCEIVNYPSYILDVGRESDLDVIHLVLFTRLILYHYSSARPAGVKRFEMHHRQGHLPQTQHYK